MDVDIDVFSHMDTTNDAFSNKGDIAYYKPNKF